MHGPRRAPSRALAPVATGELGRNGHEELVEQTGSRDEITDQPRAAFAQLRAARRARRAVSTSACWFDHARRPRIRPQRSTRGSRRLRRSAAASRVVTTSTGMSGSDSPRCRGSRSPLAVTTTVVGLACRGPAPREARAVSAAVAGCTEAATQRPWLSLRAVPAPTITDVGQRSQQDPSRTDPARSSHSPRRRPGLPPGRRRQRRRASTRSWRRPSDGRRQAE